MKPRRPSVRTFAPAVVLATLAAWLGAQALAQAPKTASKVEKPALAAAAKPKPEPFERYVETIPDSNATFEMLPIPGGTFAMGSPAKEKGRKKDEGPVHEVTVRPFWMSKTEVTWAEYSRFLDIGVESLLNGGGANEEGPDAVTYPTPPYADETFGYGGGKQPAIALTIHAVMEYTRWLSKVTGKSYRLPTEAEWEYACRAGTTTTFSFGAAPRTLGDFAWWKKNADKHPHPVGLKQANPFGLHDMHGNVAEWVLDQYAADFYAKPSLVDGLPFNRPGERRFPHVVRGGGWKDDAPALRCAARRFSEKWWSKQDPQTPQSIWWHTEATDVGFRIVRVPDEYPGIKGLKSLITEDSP